MGSGEAGWRDTTIRFRRSVPSARTERRRDEPVGSDASQARVAAMYQLVCTRRPARATAAVLLVHVCLVSLVLVWCPVSCEESSLTSRMRAISEDLDRQLNEIMASQAVSYTTVNTVELPYNATTRFNPKGMGQLYNVTNMFIDLVQSKQAYPDGE